MIRAVEGRSCQGEQAVGEGSCQREPEGSLGLSHVRGKSSGGRGQQVQRPWGGASLVLSQPEAGLGVERTARSLMWLSQFPWGGTGKVMWLLVGAL